MNVPCDLTWLGHIHYSRALIRLIALSVDKIIDEVKTNSDPFCSKTLCIGYTTISLSVLIVLEGGKDFI